MTWLARAVGSTALAGAACVTYGTLIERRWYRLAHVRVEGVLRHPGRLRILHVTDLHLLPRQRHRIAFVHGLADLDHDLVVATGDLLGGPDAEDAAAAALAPLTSRGRPGLSVIGSNDQYGPVPKAPWRYLTDPRHRTPGIRLDTDRLLRRLERVGYTTLRGGTVTVDIPAGVVAAGGFDDPHLDPSVIPTPDVVTPQSSDAIVHLGLVHAPYLAALDVLVDAGHDLLLAGHTHGGQVRLPGIGALVANCDLPLDQASGLSRYRDRWLHVSAGLGHSPYAPFRFACRPEATLLELTG
ncbi:MAG: metallophosphoesterase [Nitriliruptoraceae bacterium]